VRKDFGLCSRVRRRTVCLLDRAQAQKKVRFAYPSSADMGDVPSLLAWEQLKKQGIEVVADVFPEDRS
jgi:hypothetical protein